MGSRKIPPGKIFTWKIPTHQTPPWKITPPPGKFPPGIFPPISLIAFLHLTLRFDNVHGWKDQGKQKFEDPKNLLVSKMLFRNVQQRI